MILAVYVFKCHVVPGDGAIVDRKFLTYDVIHASARVFAFVWQVV